MEIGMVVMASISAVSGAAGVVTALLATRRQKLEGLSALMHAVVLEHQTKCPIGDKLFGEIVCNRKEMMAALESSRKEFGADMRHVNSRLDAILGLVTNSHFRDGEEE